MGYTKADIIKKLTPVVIQFDDNDKRSEFCETHMYEVFRTIPEEFKNDKEIVTYALSNCYDDKWIHNGYCEDAVKILKNLPKKMRTPDFIGELVGKETISFAEVREAFNDQKLIDEAAITAANIFIGEDFRKMNLYDKACLRCMLPEVSNVREFLEKLTNEGFVDSSFLDNKNLKELGLKLNKVNNVSLESDSRKNKAIVAENKETGNYKTELDSNEQLTIPEISDDFTIEEI